MSDVEATRKNELDEWDEDTPVEVLKRYLATFGEPKSVPAETQFKRLPGYKYYEDYTIDDRMAGKPHCAPDPRRPRWVSCPNGHRDRALELLHLGLSCPIAIVGARGRRAPSDPYKPPWFDRDD